MPKVFTSKTQKTGALGESIACRHLQSKGYRVIERNYTRKWGEIDIVAEKSKRTHFIEVKCVSCVTLDDINTANSTNTFRPEENMHHEKLKRLYRTIEGYLASNNVLKEWQLDLLCVYIVHDTKKAKVTFFENI